MSDVTEPRRYKLPSELNADDREAASRFGAEGRVERDEYRKWRRNVLREERNDLPLRVRLLEEQAEAIRARAADQETAALEELNGRGLGRPYPGQGRRQGHTGPRRRGGRARGRRRRTRTRGPRDHPVHRRNTEAA